MPLIKVDLEGGKLPGRTRRAELKAFDNLKQLVQQLGVQPEVQKERLSITWTSSGTRVRAPADIVRHGCSCARLENFAVHMSVDCMGLGPYNVAKRSSFNTEAEVAPALLHAAKARYYVSCDLFRFATKTYCA